MNIDGIKNGLVLDHIKAGCAMRIYKLLRLDRLSCSVAVIQNATSTKYTRKDIIKIWCPFLGRLYLIRNLYQTNPAGKGSSGTERATGRYHNQYY